MHTWSSGAEWGCWAPLKVRGFRRIVKQAPRRTNKQVCRADPPADGETRGTGDIERICGVTGG